MIGMKVDLEALNLRTRVILPTTSLILSFSRDNNLLLPEEKKIVSFISSNCFRFNKEIYN